MDDQSVSVNNEQLRYVLLKNPENRSYDDLLVLKGFIGRTEFMQKNLAGIVNPKQMNDLCRQLGLESYNVGDTVFNQGDIGDKVFILLDGACDLRVRYRIDLTQGESEIREKFIKTYKERGSYFGERALQFDEPRSGTVIASAYTNLITVNKNSYISVIKEARLDLSNETVASAEQLGTKESVITVLSKMRDKRSNQELDAVAGYLFRRIPFFQRFTMPQLIELCRVAETVSVWGRSILFKQGSVGQAFYVVLTGTVEVWVNNNTDPTTTNTTATNATTPNNRIQHRSQDVTDGLGIKVNQLVSGEIFGERALENEDSLRMASIVTCEGNTELIIISREDYHNLVYVMMHADSMNRLTLLRRTDIFRTVDVQHLKSLARFMEPRKYQLNECLYKVGTKALEIIIIESGECRVETEIREGLDHEEQIELEKQKRNGYRDATHTGSSGVNTGISTLTNSALTTTVCSPIGGAAVTLTEVSTRPFSGGGDGTSPDGRPAGAGSSPQRKFSLPMIASVSTKTKAAAEIAAAAAAAVAPPPPQPLSKDPINSVAAKMKLKRLQTQQMIPLGRTHTVNLGRIAPNAVLATYITTGSLADDIFHPETVIASSLVHAYTIGKHDFFNHLPKDTRFAIEKIIAEYKPPELVSLWQNNPKKMDEDLWKKEKAWKLFKHEMSHDHRRNSNILDSYRKLEAVHLSANSGNDRYTMINLKNQALTQSRDLRANGSLVYVDSNWGMRVDTGDVGEGGGSKADTKTDTKTESGVKAPEIVKRHSDAAKHHPVQLRKTSTQHDAGTRHDDKHGHVDHGSVGHHQQHQQGHGYGVHYADLQERYHADIEAEELAHPLHRHADRGAHLTTAQIVGTNASIISSAVSHMIRNRLNHAHYGESKLKKELFSIHAEHTSALSMDSTTGFTNTYDETAQLLGGAPDHGAHAFYLVQMHRETSKNLSGGLLDNAKRMVRCYMRLCGACSSTNAAKKLADAQMENIYLTLFRSDPSTEKELLLNWSAFKGYDSISVSDTDHFLVYCRGAPILFASISPSKNIFNSPFPALCKQRGQRYACIVVNKLNPMHANKKPTRQQPSDEGSHRRHRAQHSTHASQEESDSGDEENERHHNSRLPNNLRRGGHNSSAVSMTRSDERPTTSMEQATASPTAPGPTTVSSISTKVRPAAVSVKARSSSMDFADPTAVPKPNTASDPTSSNSDASSVSAAGQLPSSEYLMEFSVLNEVLLTSTSRMECLKYAISRFGTMSDPQGGGGPLTSAESEGRVHAKNKIFIRPINPSHPDRILALLHTGRRVCVVPLFNWILINDDTTKTLDFTNGFNHAAHELVFIEEELEHSRLTALAFGSQDSRSVVGASASATEKIDTSTTLFKSFAEVGMLHSEHMIDDDNSRYLPKNESIGQHRLTNVRSLQLLERDLTSKEMSQNVIKRVSQGQQADSESVSSDQASLPVATPKHPNSGTKRVSTALSTSSSLGALRTQENAAHPEVRLRALNEVVDSVDKLMDVHDKLCEVEHNAELTAASSGVFHGSVRSPTKRAINLNINIPGSTSNSEPITATNTITTTVTKHQSLTRTKETIAKRMNVIESLQNLKFQRATVDNVMDGYNARVNREIAASVAAAAQGAAPTKRGGKSSNQPNVLAGNLNFNSNSSSISNVAVGKRLADSIQLLSDSLASKLNS